MRADRTEVVRGESHLAALLTLAEQRRLTEEQLDEMILAGRVEFGCAWPAGRDSAGALIWEFSTDETRMVVYSSVAAIRSHY